MAFQKYILEECTVNCRVLNEGLDTAKTLLFFRNFREFPVDLQNSCVFTGDSFDPRRVLKLQRNLEDSVRSVRITKSFRILLEFSRILKDSPGFFKR